MKKPKPKKVVSKPAIRGWLGELELTLTEIKTKGTKAVDESDYRKKIYEAMKEPAVFSVPPTTFIFRTFPPPEPVSEEQRLRKELENANARVEQYEKAIQQLSESACLLGIVGDVKDGRATVRMGPLVVEAAVPRGQSCEPGDFVKIVQPSQQILAVTKAPRVGATASVEVVFDGECEASVNGQRRRLVVAKHCGKLKPGDNVVVDDSGYIAMAKAADGVESQIFAEETGVTWADIGGLDEAKEALREAIEYPIRFAKLYHGYGQRPSKGVLLYGPPGCGKTMVGKATASAIRAAHGSKAPGGFLYVKGPEILNKYVGATEEAVRSLFQRARRYKLETGHAAVLFIDEADAILGSRGGRSLGGMESTVVPAFLAEMDGLDDSGAFVMLSTNRSDSLDAAIVRDGRIDRKIRVGRPDPVSARQILDLHLRHRPLADDGEEVCAAAIETMFADHTIVRAIGRVESREIELRLRDVLSGAVIAGIVHRAIERALRRDRDHGHAAPSGITSDDARAAVVASARELRDTDLASDMMDVLVREIGHEGVERMGKSAPAKAQEMN